MNRILDLSFLNKKKGIKINNGTVGWAIAHEVDDDIIRMFDIGLHTQLWADLLGVDLFDINQLPISQETSIPIEERIDVAIKNKYAELLKRPDIMAKVLGSKEK